MMYKNSLKDVSYAKNMGDHNQSQELPPFPWHTLATDIFYWKRMDFLIVADVFSKYFLVRKLANSTSAAICAELVTIVTELGLPHIIKSDNGACYNSKEFQQFLQCYNITHHTSSPHHPRSNGFIERMAGVAKKLMDKAGKEGKPWISGLYEYRVTPQSGSIASPLQLITQRTPRQKDLPQLLSTLGAQEMYETQQELTKRQQNKPEKSYIELTPGTPVWGSTQAKYNLGTSNSCKPMYHKLLLDHAREWYRAAKSVQEDQIYAKDQIHPDRSRADRVQEQPIDRTRES